MNKAAQRTIHFACPRSQYRRLVLLSQRETRSIPNMLHVLIEKYLEEADLQRVMTVEEEKAWCRKNDIPHFDDEADEYVTDPHRIPPKGEPKQ